MKRREVTSETKSSHRTSPIGCRFIVPNDRGNPASLRRIGATSPLSPDTILRVLRGATPGQSDWTQSTAPQNVGLAQHEPGAMPYPAIVIAAAMASQSLRRIRLGKTLLDDLGQMEAVTIRALRNLLTATESIAHDQALRRRLTYRRKKNSFATGN